MATAVHSEVERYLQLPYRVELTPAEGQWFVEIPDLPGCMSQGDTAEAALAMIRDAQVGWIEERLEAGLTIPAPRPEPDHRYTGRFSVRVPRDLHRALVAVAERQGASLNLYVATALAGIVAGGSGATSPVGPGGPLVGQAGQPWRNSPSDPGVAEQLAGIRTALETVLGTGETRAGRR